LTCSLQSLPLAILCLMNSFSCGVSRETASIQWRLQMFLASSQSTSKLRVGPCSQLKKYACATPLASLYVECRTPVNINSCDSPVSSSPSLS
jgi:hypothetical protein